MNANDDAFSLLASPSRYNHEVTYAAKEGVRAMRSQGMGMGFFFFVIYGAYGLAYW